MSIQNLKQSLTNDDCVKSRLQLGKQFGDQYLTKRETDVLKCVVLGYTAKQIGQRLNISFRTVEAYIEILKLKLQCCRKGDIVKKIITSGLITVLDLIKLC